MKNNLTFKRINSIETVYLSSSVTVYDLSVNDEPEFFVEGVLVHNCPAYATPSWVPIENIVAPGEACACGGRCRCTIIYKPAERNPVNLSDRLESIIEA